MAASMSGSGALDSDDDKGCTSKVKFTVKFTATLLVVRQLRQELQNGASKHVASTTATNDGPIVARKHASTQTTRPRTSPDSRLGGNEGKVIDLNASEYRLPGDSERCSQIAIVTGYDIPVNHNRDPCACPFPCAPVEGDGVVGISICVPTHQPIKDRYEAPCPSNVVGPMAAIAGWKSTGSAVSLSRRPVRCFCEAWAAELGRKMKGLFISSYAIMARRAGMGMAIPKNSNFDRVYTTERNYKCRRDAIIAKNQEGKCARNLLHVLDHVKGS
ncbi:hypothetical protein B7494_g3081 [Chlorociboria aeruginascens]|nr:hypothetical protein B7494_g3081 [Chlorociboria aeruginascens]